MYIKDSISSKLLTKRKFPSDVETRHYTEPFWLQKQNLK